MPGQVHGKGFGGVPVPIQIADVEWKSGVLADVLAR